MNGIVITGTGGASTFASLTDISYSAVAYNLYGPGSLSGAADGNTHNTAYGIGALTSTTATGTYNVAIGSNALNANTTGDQNVAVGNSALQSNQDGGYNTAVGLGAAGTQINATGNSAFGASTLSFNSDGSYNTGIGVSALLYSETSLSTAVGAYALGGSAHQYANVALGAYTGPNSILSYMRNVTVSNSVFLGAYAGTAVSSSQGNILIGYNAGAGITTGNSNTVIGTNISPYSNTGNYQLNLVNAIWGNVGSGTGNRNLIGINITSPTQSLEVSGTVSATRFVGDGSGLTGISGASSGDNIASGTTKVTANTTGYVSFTTGGTTTGYMDTAGKFILPGVSTTGPISATSMYAGNIGATGSVIYRDANGVLSAASGFYYNTANASLYAPSGVIGGATAGVTNGPYLVVSNSVPLIRTANVGQDLSFGANGFGGPEAMRITSSALVGIGTATPTYNLHVSGSIFASSYVYTPWLRIYDPTGATSTLTSTTLQMYKYNGYSAANPPTILMRNGNGATNLPSGAILGELLFAANDDSYQRFGVASIRGLADGTQTNTSMPSALSFAVTRNNATAYVEAMRIVSTGYVGIGISTPTTPLEVSGTVSATHFVGDGSLLTGIVGASSGDNITSGTTKVTANTTGYISFTTGGTTTGYMNTAGVFVLPGISTTGTVSATDGYYSGNVGIGGAPGGNQLSVNGITQSTGYKVGSTGYLFANDNTSSILGNAAKYLAFTTSSTEAMRIVSTGYVGIGTTAPNAKLEVAGTASATLGFFNNVSVTNAVTLGTLYFTQANQYNGTNISTYGATLYNNAGAASGGSGYILSLRSNDISGGATANQNIGALNFQSDYNYSARNAARISAAMEGTGTTSSMPGRLVFSTTAASSVTPTERMRIDSNGAVGIGITPTQTSGLEVSGTVSATRFVGDGSGLTNLPVGSVTDGVSGSIVFRDATGNLTARNTFLISATTGSVGIGASPVNVGNNGLYVVGNIAASTFYAGDTTGLAWGAGNTKVTGNSPSNYIAFTTSGTEAMRIVSTGYVGIGTSAPTATLQVSSTLSNAGDTVHIEGYTNSSGLYVFNRNSAGYGLYVGGSGSNYLAGNVGIGTSTPSTTLHVYAASNPNLRVSTATRYAQLNESGLSSGNGSLSINSGSTNNVLILPGSTGGKTGVNLSVPTTELEVSGTVSATHFVGDGSGLTGIVGASNGDNITSGTTKVTANTTGYVSFTTGGTTTGYMDTSGNFIIPGVSATGPVSATSLWISGDIHYSGTLNDTSDRRLKTNIQPLPYATVLDRMMLLKPVQYERKAVPGRLEWGFIAQDVERQFPQLVTTAGDPSGTKSVSYLGLFPPMVRAIQELKADNDDLRAQVRSLKAANDNLEARLDSQQHDIDALKQRDIDAPKQRDIDAPKQRAGMR
ncbi:tail fiber domain-containing protein [Bradyrhizobium sp. CSA207]|uniref:tail fiber domain-containing protein n=1 Tax=Bradyrhizobium sp. CSA207 TaxID=2698826 RepID=UPI0023AEB822|nr:tail fiber domain-containing protein [Bradyrhizobium sp. CSA207]